MCERQQRTLDRLNEPRRLIAPQAGRETLGQRPWGIGLRHGRAASHATVVQLPICTPEVTDAALALRGW